MAFDPEHLKTLERIRDSARKLGGQIRADPRLLERMDPQELAEMHEQLRCWRPLLAQAVREMGNLEVAFAKAVRRRGQVRA